MFDTQIINDFKYCRLKLIGHLFSNLLIRAKKLKYIFVIINDKQIVKKIYSEYLKTIYIKTNEMIKNAKNTLNTIKNIEHIFKINIIIKELLKIMFTNIELTISQRAYENAITDHIILLTHSIKAIRREILFLIILANNFINKARKTHANLTIIIEFLLLYIDKHALREIDRKIFNEKNGLVIKNESINDADLDFGEKQIDATENDITENLPDTKEETDTTKALPSVMESMDTPIDYMYKSMKGNSKNQKSKLPIIFISILNVYKYLCAECSPNFEKKMKKKFIQRVK